MSRITYFNLEWPKVRFEATMPEGFDGRTLLRFFGAELYIVHPDMPPHRLNRQKKMFEKVEYLPR